MSALCHHHPPILMAGPFCQNLKHQLMAIYSPACYDIPGATPFQFDPTTCEPNDFNTYSVSMWCGWECRNSYDSTGALERQFDGSAWNPAVIDSTHGLGEQGAMFGAPRSGVGWQDQQGMDWRDIEGNIWDNRSDTSGW